MFKFVSLPGAVALALLLSPNAWSAGDADLDDIRSQIKELKSSYEARIRALEDKLKEAEAKSALAAPVAAPAPMPSAASSSLSAFNPAISVVLQGRYANLSQDPARFAIAGFAPGGDTGPGRRGFSLGESELVMAANVDDKFAGNLIVSLSPENTVSVEEAYGLWLTAPYGLVPKFGRFFSGLGYMNEQHQHAWDFIDAPLAYQAFLGGQYATDGIQAKWVAPIDQYFELGAEAGSGGFPDDARDRNGASSRTVFAHTGGDIGASHSWRAGLSYLQTSTRDVAVADFIWKYAPNGNGRDTNFKLQGEYLQGRTRGDSNDGVVTDFAARQSGWYMQGVYQFMPTWRIGARYDRLDSGATQFNPKRYTVMLDYTPSEFSRFRVQFAQSRTLPDVTDNQWFLQYILSLGAHGAHKY